MENLSRVVDAVEVDGNGSLKEHCWTEELDLDLAAQCSYWFEGVMLVISFNQLKHYIITKQANNAIKWFVL